MKNSSDTLEDFEKVLGYSFQDKKLIYKALTHTSYASEKSKNSIRLESNQRLEFLGDAALGLITGTYIYDNYPAMSEGDMSRLRASVVCESALAELARKLSVDMHIFLGVGEEQTGGRGKPSILADAFESILGAIYLDGGFESARRVLLMHITAEINDKANNYLFLDSKTNLQEYMTKKRLSISYTIIDAVGPEHDKLYKARVDISNGAYAFGEGRTKKEAERQAAEKMLKALREEREETL